MIYQPREDSFLLEKEVKKISKGCSFLDLGSGSGIQAKAAMSSGASFVLAADIDNEFITELKKQGINAIQSDMFENVKEKFDIIAFNPPYLPDDKAEDDKSKIATTGGKRGDEIILRFLKQAKSHLNDKGVILLLISSLTPKEKINSILKKKNMDHIIIASESFFMEKLEVWKIIIEKP